MIRASGPGDFFEFTIEEMMEASPTTQINSLPEAGNPQSGRQPKQFYYSDIKREVRREQLVTDTKPITAKKPEKSGKLLLEATRNFGCIQRPSREEIDVYKELFYQLVERVPESDKRLISAMLARGVFTPRPVALYLAQDRVEIAAPFLLYSPVLGDLDLRAIAQKKGAEHAAIVARRRLPMDNFTVSTLHEVISKPATSVEPIAHDEEKKFLDPITKPAKTAQSEKWLEGEEILALASVGGRLGKKQTRSTKSAGPVAPSSKPEIADFGLPKTETRKLLQLARKRQMAELAKYVEELCGLERASTLKLIGSQKNELTYLVKALGLSAPHDIQLLMMLVPAIGRDVSAYRETKKTLGNLDAGICRMIFNEIGARFEMGHKAKITPVSSTPADSGFSQAVQRRRESLEQAPQPQRKAGNSRFSFEQSFLAAG